MKRVYSQVSLLLVCLGLFTNLDGASARKRERARARRNKTSIAAQTSTPQSESVSSISSSGPEIVSPSEAAQKKSRFWPDFSKFTDKFKMPSLDDWKKRWGSWKQYLNQDPDMRHVQEVDRERVSMVARFAWAEKAFNPTGPKTDMTGYIFGKPTFLLKDAIGISTPIVDGALVSTETGFNPSSDSMANHYLAILADQPITFDAKYNRQEAVLTYQRLFMKKRLHLFFTVPFVRMSHTLTLKSGSEITAANRGKLAGATSKPPFYEKYNSLENYLDEVLKANGSVLDKSQTLVGVGDIRVGLSYLCNVKYIDRCYVGALLSCGSGKSEHGIAAWEPQLGNGGASSVTLLASAGWHRGKNANPFVRCGLSYNIPTRTVRRVPLELVGDGVGAHNLDQVVHRSVYGSNFMKTVDTKDFKVSESTVRHFGSQVHPVFVHKGIGFTFELGNEFMHCFNQPLSIGASYLLTLRQEETIKLAETQAAGAATLLPKVVSQNTGRRQHKLKAHVDYRFRDEVQFRLGGSFVFGGKNIPAEYGFSTGLIITF